MDHSNWFVHERARTTSRCPDNFHIPRRVAAAARNDRRLFPASVCGMGSYGWAPSAGDPFFPIGLDSRSRAPHGGHGFSAPTPAPYGIAASTDLLARIHCRPETLAGADHRVGEVGLDRAIGCR